MAEVIRVEFSGPARHQYSPVPNYALRVGDVVVVETDWGVGMGAVGAVLSAGPLGEPGAAPHRIIRKATMTDLSRRQGLMLREREARAFCWERIQARGLPMKLTEVRIGLDSSKAMFYFTAEGRVDFRELVKDLTQHLRTRVELRQIGVRDEARVLGSAGPCGRPLCCRAFLQTFSPVSIRMAKDQNLALNPGKLSGMCGRLKCCLSYEHPLYAELRRGLPKLGCCVTTRQGQGVIRGQNILEQTVLIALETGGQLTLRPTEVTVRPRPQPQPKSRRRGDEDASGAEAGRGMRERRADRGVPAEARGENGRIPEPAAAPDADDFPPDLAKLEDV
jgi:cell fate regulator YaaT (PSP1 superfamily)